MELRFIGSVTPLAAPFAVVGVRGNAERLFDRTPRSKCDPGQDGGGSGEMGEVGESAPKVERLKDEVFRLLVECTERDQCD